MAAVTHAVGTASTSNAATYASASFTPAVGDLLVVFAIVSGSIDAGDVSNSAGINFTKVGSAVKVTSADTLYCFVANSLVTSAVSMTCTMDVTGDNGTGCVIAIARVSGMFRTGAAEQLSRRR